MEIKKTILIIKSASRAMNAAEQFLRNRDWQIQTTTNIKEALDYLVQHKPHFVMVAVDHPVKKIRTLPKLLPQAFPVCVIAFSEQTTTQAYKLLIDSGCEYRINPPVTGPAIERVINKYVKDQELLAAGPQAKAAATPEKLNQNPGTFVMKGNSSLAPSSVNMQGERTSSPENDLAAALLQHIESVDEDSAEFGSINLPGMARNRTGQISGNVGTAPEQKMGDISLGKPAQSHIVMPDAKATGELPTTPAGEKQNTEGPRPATAQGSAAPNLSAASQGPSAGSLAAKSDGPDHLPFLNSQSAVRAAVKENSQRGNAAPLMGWDKNDSVIGRGTQKALDDISDHSVAGPEGKIDQSSRVACIVVESARFSGYLVAAMGQNCPIEEAFIKLIKERLFKFLQDQGEGVKNEEDMDIRIRQVDFEDWALEYADFLRKSVHGGNELAMAFFPFTRAVTKLGESLGSAEMGAVKMEDLQGDLQVDFNLYIYLPANNRYVLYTPKGSKFYGNQKERLTGMGVTHLHMRKSETQDLSKYRAQNYLNAKIEQYSQKKGSKKAS